LYEFDGFELAEAARSGHSWLERRFLELCASAGLPRPSAQQITSQAKDRLVRVDCRFVGTTLIVEVVAEPDWVVAQVRSGLQPFV
jgi:hypothetical protein